MFACLVALLATLTNLQEKENAASRIIEPGDRIVFLGDSNTYAGGFISYLDAHVRRDHPEMKLEMLNLGLPSETVTGLSEEAHPYPRPNVHTRINNVLKETSPDVVFICYGMNDGIYRPVSKARYGKYQEGITKAVQLVKDSGAKVVLMTPPPFDPLPGKRKGTLQDAYAKEFSWTKIYDDYDTVMRVYAEWVMTQKDNVDLAIDLHVPFNKMLADKRKEDPDFAADGDGVHFGDYGHKLIAEVILNAFTGETPDLEFDKEYFKLVSQRQTLLRDAWVTHCGHERPNTKQGKPLQEASKEAAELEEKINQLLKKE